MKYDCFRFRNCPDLEWVPAVPFLLKAVTRARSMQAIVIPYFVVFHCQNLYLVVYYYSRQLITVINTDIWLSLILPPDNCLSGWENNFIDTSKNKRKSPQGVNNG